MLSIKKTKLVFLRTTVLLVSYIRFLSDFGIMPPLVPVVKILKNIGATGKIWEKAGIKLLKDLTEKSVNFSTLATSKSGFCYFLVKTINK